MGGKGIDLEVKAVFPGEVIHVQQVDLVRTGDADDRVSLPRAPPVHRVIFAGETEFHVIMPLPAPPHTRQFKGKQLNNNQYLWTIESPGSVGLSDGQQGNRILTFVYSIPYGGIQFREQL